MAACKLTSNTDHNAVERYRYSTLKREEQIESCEDSPGALLLGWSPADINRDLLSRPSPLTGFHRLHLQRLIDLSSFGGNGQGGTVQAVMDGGPGGICRWLFDQDRLAATLVHAPHLSVEVRSEILCSGWHLDAAARRRPVTRHVKHTESL